MSGDIWPFLLTGLFAPGASQFLYVRSVKEVGASRAAIVVGAAPLVSVTIALALLGEPIKVPLLLGAMLIVLGCLALGLSGYGLAAGHAANFILMPAENVGDALVRRPHQRTVVSHGRVIARDGRFLESRQG